MGVLGGMMFAFTSCSCSFLIMFAFSSFSSSSSFSLNVLFSYDDESSNAHEREDVLGHLERMGIWEWEEKEWEGRKREGGRRGVRQRKGK